MTKPAPDFSARSIWALALPALGSLVIEPLLILIDTFMIGHLGTMPLAGLSLASTVLTTVVGVFVFLAYSTTGAVARATGAGNQREAISAGAQALWLAGLLGVLAMILLFALASPLLSALGATGEVHQQAVWYLRSSAPGLIGMFVILSANGLLRGLLDTRTPLRVLAWGALGNVAVNVVLIYVLNWGIIGAGSGVSLAQNGMAVALVWAVVRIAHRERASLRPRLAGIGKSFGEGIPLLVRTIALRAAILMTTAAITRVGATSLAANQVANSVWQIFQFGLDSLAIAAQGLIGVAVGAKDQQAIRFGSRRLIWWGVSASIVLGLLLAVTSRWLTPWLTGDPEVQRSASLALVVIGILMPLAGWAYLLDGVLIGAGETKFMAVSSMTMVAAYTPALVAIWWWANLHQPLSIVQEMWVFLAICLAYNGWMSLVRVALNQFRVHRISSAVT